MLDGVGGFLLQQLSDNHNDFDQTYSCVDLAKSKAKSVARSENLVLHIFFIQSESGLLGSKNILFLESWWRYKSCSFNCREKCFWNKRACKTVLRQHILLSLVVFLTKLQYNTLKLEILTFFMSRLSLHTTITLDKNTFRLILLVLSWRNHDYLYCLTSSQTF